MANKHWTDYVSSISSAISAMGLIVISIITISLDKQIQDYSFPTPDIKITSPENQQINMTFYGSVGDGHYDIPIMFTGTSTQIINIVSVNPNGVSQLGNYGNFSFNPSSFVMDLNDFNPVIKPIDNQLDYEISIPLDVYMEKINFYDDPTLSETICQKSFLLKFEIVWLETETNRSHTNPLEIPFTFNC